jgi:CHASE2 domain-containing sensor protein
LLSISEILRSPRSRALILGVLTLLILVPVSFTTFGQLLEHYWLDFLYARRAPQPLPANLLIVGIDEPSFQELGLPWPWPRRFHATLVDRLRAARARLIIFDVVFADPTNEKDDAEFAAAIRRAGNVILAQDLDIIKICLTRFIHEGMRKPLSRRFFEAEKSTSWAERRWKKPRSDISG